MFDGGNNNRVKIVLPKVSTFRRVPCDTFFLCLNQEENQLFFFQPQETRCIDVHPLSMLFSELFGGNKVGRMRRQNREREEGIRRNSTDNAIFLRQGGMNWTYAVCYFFVTC